jgi:DHA2 family multidrug resistance protein
VAGGAQGGAQGGAKPGWTGERSAAGGGNPWIVASVVSISAFMEVLDTSIANVSLTHIAGGLSASYDEATWVLTSYLVANAITIPVSSWLSSVVGRKRYYMICVAGFGLSSLLCGMAPNLTWLIFARILQGLAGGGLQPSTQAILVDTFPPAKRGSAMALFGLTVILGPTLGPTLGGVITDNFSWHWIFLINGPVALLSLFLVGTLIVEPRVLQDERKARLAAGPRFDFLGFFLIALGLGSLEITMDRGQTDDWFSNPLISTTACLAVIGLIGFVIRELMAKEPLLDIRLFKNLNYALCNGLILIVGVILFGTVQFLPQFLQQVMGYTATTTGFAMTEGGIITLFLMPLSGVLSNKIQPRLLIGFALAIEAFAMWRMTGVNGQISFTYAAEMRMWIAAGIPFLFVPLSNAAYVGLPANKTGQAAAMLNMSRNLGGTLGISLVQTFLAQREQFHQSQLVSGLNGLNPAYQAGLARITQALVGRGFSPANAQGGALARIYQEVQRQAAVLSYVEVFWLLAVIVASAAPVVFLLRTNPRGPAAAASGGAA